MRDHGERGRLRLGNKARPAVTTATRRRVRWEHKVQDAWVGAFWKRSHWWGGTIQAFESDTAMPHLEFDLWICLVPFFPIHYQSMTCPEPRRCRAGACWVRDVGRVHLAVVVSKSECPRCRDTGRIHNVAMGPPHLDECTWCYIACPLCQGSG